MKQQSFILEIPKPCSENWNEMTPDAQGRFCSHCQKTVIDFTTWNDADLISFFKNNDQPTCGRFFNTQLNRPLTLSAQKPTKLYRIAIALGLTLLLAQAPDAYSRPKAPLVEQNILSPTSDSTNHNDSLWIRGVVYDAHKEPATGAVITLERKGIYINSTQADIDGNFSFALPNADTTRVNLKVQYTGHTTITLQSVPPNADSIIFHLEQSKKTDINTTVVGYIIRQPLDPPGKTTYTREQIHSLAY